MQMGGPLLEPNREVLLVRVSSQGWMMGLAIRPCELADANNFVARFHRHHKPVVGHRWSLAAWAGEELVGVLIAGRPVARMTDKSRVLEVTRLCTNGYKNACSFLYSAAARIAREMGFSRIQTFILKSESGDSLLAAGWSEDPNFVSAGGTWNRPTRTGRRDDQPQEPKRKFYRDFPER